MVGMALWKKLLILLGVEIAASIAGKAGWHAIEKRLPENQRSQRMNRPNNKPEKA